MTSDHNQEAAQRRPLIGGLLLQPGRRRFTGRLSALYWGLGAIAQAVSAYFVVTHVPWTWIILGVTVVMSVLAATLPWDRISVWWYLGSLYLGAAMVMAATLDSQIPSIAVILFAIAVIFADVFWQRKGVLALHLVVVYAGFVVVSLLAGGSSELPRVMIEAPLMLAVTLMIGFTETRFIELARNRRHFGATISSLVSALAARDGYTAEHSEETLNLVMATADVFDLERRERKELADAALLHDVGKIGVPNEILNKPGKLTEAEWEIMRQHPVIGERIVAGVPGFEHAAHAIRHEHERWDGGGYPDGLAGESIPLASRIILVCDAYHAMTSDRPYRDAMDPQAARDELARNAGSQFDPRVAEALMTALDSEAVDVPSPVKTQWVGAPLNETGEAGAAVPGAPTRREWHELRGRIGAAAWVACAAVGVVYLGVFHELDLVGVSLLVACLVAATFSYLLAARKRLLAAGFPAVLLATAVMAAVAVYYDEPTLVLITLLPAAQSMMFRRNRPVMYFQCFAILVLVTVLPLVMSGSSAWGSVVTAAIAFPTTLLALGLIGAGAAKLQLDQQRFTGTIASLLRALAARDGYTADHSDAALELALEVAAPLGLGEAELDELANVALLHDVGKIATPDEILNKPGKLTEAEWEIMRQHPVVGEQIVARIPGFERVAKAIRHEHERWDGDGYPDGLAGVEIPLASRIVLACDAYDAMTTDRPYRKALGHEYAFNELLRNAGTQFDPRVVGALLESVRERRQNKVVELRYAAQAGLAAEAAEA